MISLLGLQSCRDNNITEVQIKRGIHPFFPQYLSYYRTNPYDVGTLKNRLTETILLSTHSIEFKGEMTILEPAKRPLSRALYYWCICVDKQY